MEAQLLNIVQRVEEKFKVCQTLNLGESQSMSVPVHLAYERHDGMRNACPDSTFTVRSAALTGSVLPCCPARAVPYPHRYCFSPKPLLEGPQSKTECNVSVPY